PTSLTSGGVLYASNNTTIAGSAALTVNVLTKGGGAGAAPTNSSVTYNGTTIASTEPVVLGTDGPAGVAGTVQLSKSAAAAHTIFKSAATTTNTIAGFTVVPTTGDLVSCTSATTVCTLTDSGVLAANVLSGTSLLATEVLLGAGSQTVGTVAGANNGDLLWFNGTTWVVLTGNTTASNCLQESSGGTPSWATCATGGGDSISTNHNTLNISGPNTATVLDVVGAAGEILAGA